MQNYLQRLNLEDASLSRIEHEDAMVAVVYKITAKSGEKFVLKICDRVNDYLREVYFLTTLAGKLPIPRLIKSVPPEKPFHGAILMEYLSGGLLHPEDFNDEIAFDLGAILARIHLNRLEGYGDPIHPRDFSSDPKGHFIMKFEEHIAECKNHLTDAFLEKCRHYCHTASSLLHTKDGPCIVHRDFRPGNVIVQGGEIEGIIDWAGARSGFAEEDFCALEHGEWPSNPASKKSFLNGYASIRRVPEYRAMMPLLRLSKALGTVGFTVKRNTFATSASRLYQYNRRFLDTFF